MHFCRYYGLAAFLMAFIAQAQENELFRRQIEADWLHQDDIRLKPSRLLSPATAEEDAAGGVDGLKNGQWGFHTAEEDNPWWQVDLQRVAPLERVVVYNRCDAMVGRNARIHVLLSTDGVHFQLVYQHPGTVFLGHVDQKPLVVNLAGAQARYIRLSLAEHNYLHLDEVEVYTQGGSNNEARNKPATQSSTSQWSVRHGSSPQEKPPAYPFAKILERGQRLADNLRSFGMADEPAQTEFATVAQKVKQQPDNAADETQKSLYLRTHWSIRKLALANPLLNFDSLLFVKHAPTMFPHMSDQHYGWWSRPGGGIFILEGFKTSQPRVRCMTEDFPPGSFTGPDLSWDGKKVLFAYCRYYPHVADMEKVDKSKLPADAFYKVYEMNIDGSGRRQITQGRYDDFDARYLPDGSIAFLSTRKGLALQSHSAFSESTRLADLPDSYVRCGGDRIRPVPVFTLHAMDADGNNLRPLSSFENFEWTPSVAADGRILYTRWDYIDRFNGHFFSLWSANQDGTNPQLVYGNYTVKPQVKFEARSIPGSSKLVMTAGAHHSITGGSICLLDRTQGTEMEAPITRLTPEVCFPETEGWPEHYYANPWPLSENYFLLGWADRPLPPHSRVTDERNPINAMGIYLYDAFGNQELLYRDPQISSMYPIPVAPRTKPPEQAPLAQWHAKQEGCFLVQNVYEGLGNIAPGSVKKLRLIGVPPKTQPFMNNPVLGVSAEDPGKFVLGTVPVEPDGSAYFRVPSGVPLFFQAVNEEGLAVQTMRSLAYVMPDQTLGCIGCHEHRDTAPTAAGPLLAARREPSRISPGPEGSWPLRFDRLVQPVLDRYCVACHQSGMERTNAAYYDLTPAHAYDTLLSFGGGDLKKLAFEQDRSFPGKTPAINSKLWSLLTRPGGHHSVRLDADNLNRLSTWMDTYAQRVGHYSDEQEKALSTLRQDLSSLIDSMQ